MRPSVNIWDMGVLERFWSKVEKFSWLSAFVLGAVAVFAAFSAHVYLQLSTVRPLLVFIQVDRHAPPICGICVLFP